VPIARAESTCPIGLSRGEPWVAKQYRQTGDERENCKSSRATKRRATRRRWIAQSCGNFSCLFSLLSSPSPSRFPATWAPAKVPYFFAGVFFFLSDSALVCVCSMSSIYCSILTTRESALESAEFWILNRWRSLLSAMNSIVRRKRKTKGMSAPRAFFPSDFSFVRIAGPDRTFAAYVSSSAEFSPSSVQPFLFLTCGSQFSICSRRIKPDCAARCAVAVKSQSKLRAPVNAQWPWDVLCFLIIFNYFLNDAVELDARLPRSSISLAACIVAQPRCSLSIVSPVSFCRIPNFQYVSLTRLAPCLTESYSDPINPLCCPSKKDKLLRRRVM